MGTLAASWGRWGGEWGYLPLLAVKAEILRGGGMRGLGRKARPRRGEWTGGLSPGPSRGTSRVNQ